MGGNVAAGAAVPGGLRSLFAWYGELGQDGRRAFWAAFGGMALAAFDLLGFSFVLDPVRRAFGLSEAQVGVLATASLLSSAAGGVIGGVLADRVGRVPALMVSVATYAAATFACGFAQGYESLLIFRVLLGLGFGGEWTAGALIVAEYAPAAARGRALGTATSGFVAGDALAALAAAILARAAPPDLGWRVLCWLGVLPALLLIWIRLDLREPPVATARSAPTTAGRAPRRLFGTIFVPPLLATTAAATALATGALSGRYVVTVWLPTFLRTGRGLDAAGVGAAMLPLLAGAWFGYVLGGYAHDLLGHRRAFAFFAVAAAAA